MRSPGQLLALGIALASAPAQTGNSGGASFAGADSEQWAERLRETGAVAGGQLALGLAQDPSSLTVVRALLAHADRTVVEGAIDACRAAGPAASSLRAELLELLVGAPAWWTQERAAHAIAAAGTGDAAVVSALLDHVCRSDVPRMRGECARALETLGADVLDLLLAKVHARAFGDDEWAIELLRRRDESAIPRLVTALGAPEPVATIAAEALARFGWRAVDALERAGHAALAQRALTIGPLVDVAFADEFVVEPPTPEPPMAQLPVLRWESGSGHGQKLHLWRASEDSRGLRVLELTLSGGARGTVRVREGWIPRARAFGALRQLAVLARLEPRRRPQPGDFASESWSSANFHARVRCEVAGETVLAAAFTGSPSTSNLPDRFRAEAAVRVLAQAVATAQWTERAPRASDREALRERQTEQETVYWVRQRLRRLDEVLPGRQ